MSAMTQEQTPSTPNGAAPLSRAHPIWLARAFLLPRAGQGDPAAPEWRSAPHWFLLWGLVIGIVYAAVFRVSWRWFGEYQYIRFVPIAIVLIADLLWGGHRPLMSALGLLDRSQQSPREEAIARIVLLITLMVLVKYALMLSLPLGESESPGWRARLGILYPKAIYRPLVLMPLWGRWAAMLALCIGRPNSDAPTWLVRMAGSARLPWILLGWLACAVLTAFYASTTAADLARGTVISLGVLVFAYLVSFSLGRRFSGQSGATVLATAVATEFAFLALYLPVVNELFRY